MAIGHSVKTFGECRARERITGGAACVTMAGVPSAAGVTGGGVGGRGGGAGLTPGAPKVFSTTALVLAYICLTSSRKGST
jgi:hypothetical protein